MKFVAINQGAYEVSTCGRFVWSEASDKFLKVDHGCVTISVDGRGRRRWTTNDLLQRAKAPSTKPRAKLVAHLAFVVLLIAVATAHVWLDSVEHLVARHPEKKAWDLWEQVVSATAELNSSMHKVLRSNHT